MSALQVSTGRRRKAVRLPVGEPCIYFLLDSRSRVVYVGQTTNLMARIAHHLVGKKGLWASARYIKCLRHELLPLERYWIKALTPALNKASRAPFRDVAIRKHTGACIAEKYRQGESIVSLARKYRKTQELIQRIIDADPLPYPTQPDLAIAS